jgi:coenzyme F420 hydrogenase subunit beta
MNAYLDKLQTGLSPKKRLDQIVEHGMCIGCGICESIAKAGQVKMAIVESGYERPISQDTLNQQEIESIVSVCPGTVVEGLPEELITKNIKQDLIWGAWQEIYYAYSADPSVRHLAATGGLLTGLALYLLESNTVDFILHAKASSTIPSFGEATISRNRDDVLNASGSRYGPTATLIDIIKVLDNAEAHGERFAFIGTPCDVSALRNYAKLDSRVNALCETMLTMVCGGFMSPHAQQKFIEARGIEYHKIQTMRYRGNGCPGPTSIEMSDGEIHEFSYLDFWGEDDSAWQLPPRCKVCPDGIGDSADVAASDTWDGGAPTVAGAKTDLGVNAAIVRTEKGVELMHNAINAGYIVRDKNLTPDDMNRFQPHQEAKKRSVWARFEGMKRAGNIVPETQNLRIRRLSELNDDVENQAQTLGSERRVKNKAFTELTPKAEN